jgi:serine/threonine-protein kinase
MFLAPGFRALPGHLLTRHLGSGAFGQVWEAEREDGQLLALKFLDCRTLPRDLVASEVRLLRRLAALRHPNIIQLHGVHASSHYLILVMERADGNLADLQTVYLEMTRGNIPPAHALELLEQAAVALDYLADLQLAGFHSSSRGLQHCDVKPSNLLLLGDTLKVADFGLCAGTGWQTHKGGWKGTLPYAAPELFEGHATAGTDQYSLAVTVCELIMGRRPFLEGDPAQRKPTVCPIDLTKLRVHEFPVISRALHPHPSARWPSCQAFLAAFRRAAETPRAPLVRQRDSEVRLPRVRTVARSDASGS